MPNATSTLQSPSFVKRSAKALISPGLIETVVGKGYRFIFPDRRGNGADPSSHDGEIRFELVRAPVTERAPELKPERSVPAVNLESSANPSEHQSFVSGAIELEVFRPYPAAVRGLGWPWGIWLAGAVILTMGFLVFFFRPLPQPAVQEYRQITSDDFEKTFTMGEFPLPILTDSLRLYFPMYSVAGELAIGQVADVGGASGVVNSSLKSPLALDTSADGSSLLVASPANLPEAPLWIQPIPQGQPRRAGQVEARSASWSPDTRRIAYSTISGLFTIRSDGTDVRRLVSIDPKTGEQVYWPRWSPDGSRLRYSLYDPRTGYHSLWEVDADGNRAHPLLPGWMSGPNECCGNWTRDGKYFVFAATKNGRTDIWVRLEKADFFSRLPHRPFQLTAGPISFSSPLAAPNGNIFVAGSETRGELTRWDSKTKTMMPWFGGKSAVGVCSSHDGKWLTYTTFPDRTLWRSKADGSEMLQLTTPRMEAYLPRWAPDDHKIAFYARTPGKPFQIYIVSASGGTPQRPIPSSEQQIDPTWSQTGRELMFENDPWQERGNGRKTQIEIIDLQSRKPSKIPGSDGLVSHAGLLTGD